MAKAFVQTQLSDILHAKRFKVTLTPVRKCCFFKIFIANLVSQHATPLCFCR